jgi:hypothetical protein
MTGRTGIGQTRVQQRAAELDSVIGCRSADLIRASSLRGCVNRPNRWRQPTLQVATLQEALARRGTSIDVAWMGGMVCFYPPDLPVMPHKANAGRRHHIPRPKRRVTNWSNYNEALRQCGSLTVWFTDDGVPRTHWGVAAARPAQPEPEEEPRRVAARAAGTGRRCWRCSWCRSCRRA